MFSLYTKEDIEEWKEERIAIAMEGSGLTEEDARRQAEDDYLFEDLGEHTSLHRR